MLAATNVAPVRNGRQSLLLLLLLPLPLMMLLLPLLLLSLLLPLSLLLLLLLLRCPRQQRRQLLRQAVH